jgi:hypothetical protein
VILKRYEAIHPENFPNGTGVSVGTLDEGEAVRVEMDAGEGVSGMGVEQEAMNNETMNNEQNFLNPKAQDLKSQIQNPKIPNFKLQTSKHFPQSPFRNPQSIISIISQTHSSLVPRPTAPLPPTKS